MPGSLTPKDLTFSFLLFLLLVVVVVAAGVCTLVIASIPTGVLGGATKKREGGH